MSELQDAIDLLEDDKYRVPEEGKARFLVFRAARKNANPDYEAAWRHYFKGELPPEGGAYDHFCNAVNLALGITEDTGLVPRPPRQPDPKLIGRLEGDK